MIILCTGMARSGSTWSYNVCKGLLEAAFPGSRCLGLYGENVGGIVGASAADVDHLIIKCHAVDDGGRALIERKGCKLVYTYRDPRSAVASGMAVFGHEFDAMVGMVRRSFEFMDYQCRVADPLLISYAELNGSARRGVDRIAKHLGMDVDEQLAGAVDRSCGRARMRAIAAGIETYDPSELHRDETYLYHRGTLIHRNHLRERGAGWAGILSDDQLRHVDEVMRPWARWCVPDGEP